jgi:hypothetical protein
MHFGSPDIFASLHTGTERTHGLDNFVQREHGRNSLHLFPYAIHDMHGAYVFAETACRRVFCNCFVDNAIASGPGPSRSVVNHEETSAMRSHRVAVVTTVMVATIIALTSLQVTIIHPIFHAFF